MELCKAILRVFEARARPGKAELLKQKLSDTSVSVVQGKPGNLGYFFGKNLSSDERDLVFISVWEDLASIKSLFGDEWKNSFLPDGYEVLIESCSVKHIEFDGKTFCITGKLASGPRKQCEAAIRSKGGVPQSSVTRKLDYLVIGTLASRDWAQSTYGTKIERAMAIREDGGSVVVLSEEVLYQHL